MGEADIRVMHLQLVLLVAAAVGTSWAILRPIVPDLPLAVGLSGLTMMPAVVLRRRMEAVRLLIAAAAVVVAVLLVCWNSAVTLHAVLLPALGRVLMGLIVLAWLLAPPLAFAAFASAEAYAGRRPCRGSPPPSR